jgi:hypothetical protein
MKKFFIIQWIGGGKYYVKRTYSGKVISTSLKSDALLFTRNDVNKYLKKLEQLDRYGDFSIREMI